MHGLSGTRDVDLVPEVTEMLSAMLAGHTTGQLFDVSLDQIAWAISVPISAAMRCVTSDTRTCRSTRFCLPCSHTGLAIQ